MLYSIVLRIPPVRSVLITEISLLIEFIRFIDISLLMLFSFTKELFITSLNPILQRKLAIKLL